MNLHRSSGKPGWMEVPSDSRNIWQRTALFSNGFITPPNAATLIGFGLILAGIYYLLADDYILAGSLLLLGRFFDLVDGWLAEITGTKSPFGEALDATIDKIATFLTLIALPFAGVVPVWVLAVIILPQIVITFIVLRARRRKKHTHPSIYGKLGIALAWVAIGGYVLLAGLESKDLDIMQFGLGASAILSCLLSLAALHYYSKELAK